MMDIQPIANYTPAAATPSTTGPAAQPVAGGVKPAAKAVEAPPNAVQAVVAAPGPEPLKQAVRSINNTIQAFTRDIEFSVDQDTKEMVVKVMDKNTNQVIRQIPSEEALAIAKALDKLQGLIIRQKA